MTARNLSIPERFWKYVDICEHGASCLDCCWLWTGARSGTRYTPYNKRYGQLRIKGKNVRAHILSWCLHAGCDVPDGLLIKHSCDVPPCVQPAHLSAGTKSQNNQEAYDRKLKLRMHGEENGQSRLTAEDIPHIFALHAAGIFAPDIAQRYGVAASTINRALRRQYWGHVPIEADLLTQKCLHIRFPGESNPYAKLTDTDIRHIFVLRGQGLTLQAIGDSMHLHSSTVSKILLRKSWGHVILEEE